MQHLRTALSFGFCFVFIFSAPASADRACDLVFLSGPEAKAKYLVELYRSGEKLSAAEVLELDRLSAAKDQNPELAKLLASPPPEVQPSDFMRVTGYTVRERDWRARAKSFDQLLNKAPTEGLQEFLRIISRRDPHPGVQGAAEKMLAMFPDPTHDTELVLERFYRTHDDERARDVNDLAFDRALERARNEGQLNDRVDPDFLPALTGHLTQHGVAFRVSQERGQSPRVVLEGELNAPTALARLVGWIGRELGPVQVVFDPTLNRAPELDYFEVDGRTLTLPLEVARNPAILPAGVNGWLRALFNEQGSLSNRDTPWTGVVYKSPDRPEAGPTSLGGDRVQFSRVVAGGADVKVAWELLRADLRLDARSRATQESFFRLRALLGRQMDYFELIQSALSAIKLINPEALTRPAALKPQNEGGKLALTFTRGRATEDRYHAFNDWVGATFYLRGQKLLEVPLVGVSDPRDPKRFRTLAAHLRTLMDVILEGITKHERVAEVIDDLEAAGTLQERNEIFDKTSLGSNVRGLFEFN